MHYSAMHMYIRLYRQNIHVRKLNSFNLSPLCTWIMTIKFAASRFFWNDDCNPYIVDDNDLSQAIALSKGLEGLRSWLKQWDSISSFHQWVHDASRKLRTIEKLTGIKMVLSKGYNPNKLPKIRHNICHQWPYFFYTERRNLESFFWWYIFSFFVAWVLHNGYSIVYINFYAWTGIRTQSQNTHNQFKFRITVMLMLEPWLPSGDSKQRV
jgi:hypothetical protein